MQELEEEQRNPSMSERDRGRRSMSDKQGDTEKCEENAAWTTGHGRLCAGVFG